MLKQFLSTLHRKSLKCDSAESPRPDSSCSGSLRAGSKRSNNENHRSNGGGSSSSGSNSVKPTFSTAVFQANTISGIEPLVPFEDVPISDQMNLLMSKLSLCCVSFDFTDPCKNIVEKDVKRRTLIEIVDFVASGSMKFSEPAILATCRMCAVNLFRAFPPNYWSHLSGAGNAEGSGENDDDEPVFDPAWPHLQIVYEVLLKLTSSPCLDAKVAKKYIDHSFIWKLLESFNSEDPRERDFLKTILHRVYGKFMVHRPYIRKSMTNIFCRYVFESERQNGIAELLEVYGSIISGFALPLKEEHKIFFCKVLIPLHKPKSMGVYFQQLSYCVTQFIGKEPELASTVIKGLLRYWPITNSKKEVMFLSEIEEILEAINILEFQKVMVPLFRRIGCCMKSLHFQVAERALYLWNNNQIVNLISHNRLAILPLIFPALEKNAQSHWNQAVLNLTLNIRKMFMELDENLFISCHAHFKEGEATLSSTTQRRKEAWKCLEHVASLQPVVGNTGVLVSPMATSIAC